MRSLFVSIISLFIVTSTVQVFAEERKTFINGDYISTKSINESTADSGEFNPFNKSYFTKHTLSEEEKNQIRSKLNQCSAQTEQENVQISYNVINNYMLIKLDGSLNNDYIITIENTFGQTVRQFLFTQLDKQKIKVSEIPDGMYRISLKDFEGNSVSTALYKK